MSSFTIPLGLVPVLLTSHAGNQTLSSIKVVFNAIRYSPVNSSGFVKLKVRFRTSSGNVLEQPVALWSVRMSNVSDDITNVGINNDPSVGLERMSNLSSPSVVEPQSNGFNWTLVITSLSSVTNWPM